MTLSVCFLQTASSFPKQDRKSPYDTGVIYVFRPWNKDLSPDSFMGRQAQELQTESEELETKRRSKPVRDELMWTGHCFEQLSYRPRSELIAHQRMGTRDLSPPFPLQRDFKPPALSGCWCKPEHCSEVLKQRNRVNWLEWRVVCGAHSQSKL